MAVEPKPSYAPGFLNLVADPYVKAEFEKLIAYVNGVAIQTHQEEEDDGTGPTPNTPENPDEPDQEEGVRWLKGPWLLGPDGAVKAFSAIMPPQLTGNVNDYSPEGLDATILLTLSSTANVDITGIRIKTRQRRFLGILNRGGFTISLVNQSTSSQSVHRFTWGTTGDAGEKVGIPTDQMAWLYYDVESNRWKLFGIPAVGSDNLPPSITPPADPTPVPANFQVFYSHIQGQTPGASLRGVGEDNPGIVGNSFSVAQDAEGIYLQATSNATTGSAAGTGANSITANGLHTITKPDWVVFLKTGSSISACKIWIVWSVASPTNVDEITGGGGNHHWGFRYSTNAGDGGWVGVTRDGSTQSVTATVASIAINSFYKLRARFAGSSIFFSVNDGDEVEKTTNLPGVTTSMTWYCQIFTDENVAKSLLWYRHYYKLLGGSYQP